MKSMLGGANGAPYGGAKGPNKGGGAKGPIRGEGQRALREILLGDAGPKKWAAGPKREIGGGGGGVQRAQ